MHKLTLIGNLGRDPEMRYLPNGEAVTTFSVASNRKYKTSAGDQREETDWFNCSAWGKLADLANQYLEQGSQVYLEGRVKVRSYAKKDGTTAYSLDVNVDSLQFLSGGKSEQSGSDLVGAGVDSDTLPF